MRTRRWKIGVITFFRHTNPGTFLQAWCVQEALKRVAPEAKIELVNYRVNVRRLRGEKRMAGHAAGAGGLHRVRRMVGLGARMLLYKACRRRRLQVGTTPIDLLEPSVSAPRLASCGYDRIVVGSDTILEIPSAARNAGDLPLPWLPPEFPLKRIALAASAGATELDRFPDVVRSALRASVERFALFTARDAMLLDFVRSLFPVPPEGVALCPDPTYGYTPLSQAADAAARRYALTRHRPTVGIHLPETLPCMPALVAAYRSRGFRVVSFSPNRHADASMLMMSPFEWAAVFSRLSLVITERFHDTIFSLRHGVPVLTLDWDPARYRADGQSKTWCLLQQYGIEKTSHLRADASMDAADLVDAARRAEAGFDKQRIVQVNEVLRARFAAIMNRVRDALASG